MLTYVDMVGFHGLYANQDYEATWLNTDENSISLRQKQTTTRLMGAYHLMVNLGWITLVLAWFTMFNTIRFPMVYLILEHPESQGAAGVNCFNPVMMRKHAILRFPLEPSNQRA